MTKRVNGTPDRFVNEIDTWSSGSGGGGGSVDQGTAGVTKWLVIDQDAIDKLQEVIDIFTLAPYALEATLQQFRDKVPDEEGAWDGAAGTSGTVNVPAGMRVLGLTAAASNGSATVTIPGAGGNVVIPIPWITGTVGTVDVAPRANLVGPVAIDFTNTLSYLVEWVA